MEAQLEDKKELLLRTLDFQMTHEECLRLVAPSDHLDILWKAAEFANVSSSEDWMELIVPAEIDGFMRPYVALKMRTHAERIPPLMPRDPQWQPGQAGTKVIEWMTRRFEIGRRFGTARYVLRTLNKVCDNGHQLRYMWPVVLHLCKSGKDDRMDKWMEKFTPYKPCRHAPAVSREMKLAIQDTAALLTTTMLIGEDIPVTPSGFVEIGVSHMPVFTVNGELVSRL
jgi:hypothetical protein